MLPPLGVAVTAVPLFAEKARVFPGSVFVVGVDTARRLLAPRYYGGSRDAMVQSLLDIGKQGCRCVRLACALCVVCRRAR